MENNYTIREVEKRIKQFDELDLGREAFLYLKGLDEYLKNNKISEEDNAKYKKYRILLKFLCLDFLETWDEVRDLIRYHYAAINDLEYYNLWEKIKLKLLVTPSLEDRDKIKEGIKNALLKNNQMLLSSAKYSNIKDMPLSLADWLNDYNSSLGIGKVDNLKRVEYFTNNVKLNRLEEKDRKKVRNLLDLYEKTKYSSKEVRGMEDDVPMVVNGKFTMFSDGEATVVSEDLKNMIRSVSNPELKIDTSKSWQPLSTPKSKEEAEIENLQKMAEQYELGSLERRAIEEEIRKIKLNIRYSNINK
jgi:hypothetical protein